MARYALVEDNKAVNIVEWDGDVSKWEPPLRDLPANTSDPSDPTYPTKPS